MKPLEVIKFRLSKLTPSSGIYNTLVSFTNLFVLVNTKLISPIPAALIDLSVFPHLIDTVVGLILVNNSFI